MAAVPTKANATGVAEISVWMTNVVTRSAATSEGPDRSTAPADNRTSKSRGKSTTIGFHGLTRAPSTDSEYVVADGPAAARTPASTHTQTAAHRARVGVVRRRTTATQATAKSALSSVAPTKRERTLDPSAR